MLIALRATLVTLVLTGILYPLAVTGLAQVAMSHRANGSMVADDKGEVVGSELIGQSFGDPAYVHGRPSANGYDAANSGGTNLGVTSKKLRDGQADDPATKDVDESFTGVADLAAAFRTDNGLAANIEVPADAVSRSASGLDPDVSPETARLQAGRIAQARGVTVERVRAVIDEHAEGRELGFLGEPRVNVLALNLALDRKFGRPSHLASDGKATDAPVTTRPRAEDFLELVQRTRRGGLKLYIGFAAGVGKTYRMLEEAHALKKRGADVVLGFIETHGRADTAALVAGLEQVPRREVSYRGVTIEEMDLEAILARRPEVCVVDEIPHTNAPGSKNKKRYQDVLDILAAGINVIGALNVQHLESLKDVVEKASGIAIRETVPDSFLKESVQIVNLDLAVEDLLERLRAGKIYATDKVAGALEHFFRDSNLTTLRELALREVAESLERQHESKARTGAMEVRAAHSRVMVCMSSYPPQAETLLRKGSRMAGRLSGDWFVVYVETPREAPERIDSEAQRHLLANIELARELGAEVVRLQARDPVPALIDFARSHGVGHLVIGRSHQPWWRHLIERPVPLRLLAEAAELDVHIVALGPPPKEEERA